MNTRSWSLALGLLLAPTATWGQPYAYVVGAAAEAVGVVDLQSHAVIATLPLSGTPSGAVLASGRRLFVAQSRLGLVAALDVVSGTTTAISVGMAPAGMALVGLPSAVPTGQKQPRVVVANAGSDTVSVIDPAAATVVATIPVGDAPLEVAGAGARAYVANWGGGTVSVVDVAAEAVVGTVPVGRLPAGLALDTAARRLYVANFFEDTVSVIDTGSLTVVATISVGRSPRGLALDPAAGRLYVAGFESARIDVIDTATQAVVLQGPTGGANPTDVALGPGGQRLYVTHLQAGPNVRVLDAATLAELAVVTAPDGPVAIAGFGSQAPQPLAGPGRIRRAVEEVRAWLWRQTRPDSARPLVRGARAAQGTVTITDGDFAPADWQVAAATGGHVTTQQPSGGNPGSWRRSVHVGGPSFTDVFHHLVDPARQYEPSSQGPIDSIGFFWDRQHFSPGFSDEAYVVVQDGVVYRTGWDVFFSTGGWEAAGLGGLTAADFHDDGGAVPDFGPSGSVISFGYARRTYPTDATIVHGIDNFRVVVQQGGGGGPAGTVQFRARADGTVEGTFLPINLDRVGGTTGTVTATVLITTALGSFTEEITWAHGDGDPKTYTHLAVLPPRETSLLTDRLRITAVTGGASIGVADSMAVLVYPEEWELEPLVLIWLLLLASVSPAFLLLLAGPVLLLAFRRSRRGRRAAGRRAASAAVVVLLVAPLPSCLKSHTVDAGNAPDMIWNDRLRLDNQALAEDSSACLDQDLACLQRSTDPWVGHYETRDRGVVSEIYPELRSDMETARLPKSDCLWVPQGQPMRASWEAVVGLDPERQFGKAIVNGAPEMDEDADARYGQDFYPASLRWFSACRVNTPYEREWLTISQPGVCEAIKDECPDCEMGPYWAASFAQGIALNIGCEDPHDIPFGSYARRTSVFDMELRAAPYPDPRPGHNLCAAGTPGPGDANVTSWLGANCPVENALADVCGDRCLFQPDADATLSVRSVYYDRTRTLSPALMTVKKNDPRRLVRPTVKVPAGYAWSTPPSSVRNDAGPPPPEAPGLRWVENFTPDLRVTQVRALRIDAAGVETPLSPTRLRVLDPVGNGAVWDCAGTTAPDGSKVFPLQVASACRKADGPLGPLAATPTYLVSHVTTPMAPPLRAPLTWQLDLAGSTPASQVFLELMVDNQACQAPSCNTLKAEAPEKDLGRLQVGRAHRSWLEVTNLGPEPLRIGTVRMEAVAGQVDARADFALDVVCCPVGAPAPVEVDPAGRHVFGTDFDDNPILRSQTVNGQPAYVRPLDAHGAQVEVQGHSLEAVGSSRFEDKRVTSTDAAAAFSWSPTLPGGRRLFGETVYRRSAPPFHVDPGHSFWVRVTTAPRANGNRQARLRVYGTASSAPSVPVVAESLLKTYGIAGPSLTYLPQVLSFPKRRLDAAGQVQEVWRLNTMISNYGGVDMSRTTVSITGPDAARFHVASAHPATHTIPPGHDEVFLVAHDTSCATPHAPLPTYGPRQYEAQLRVTTNGGDAVVALRGEWCP
jgi:YVTN family beta-propeller protein